MYLAWRHYGYACEKSQSPRKLIGFAFPCPWSMKTLNSQILYSPVGDKGHFWLLDDHPDVLNVAKKLLPQSIEVGLAAFYKDWASKSGFRLLAIDSLVRVTVRDTPTADKWLAAGNISSNADNNSIVVLYSAAPIAGTWHRAYSKSRSLEQDIAALVSLFERTIRGECGLEDWPQELNAPANTLSRVIHDLENIVGPIRMDSERLTAGYENVERVTTEEVREIFEANFGETKGKDCGYLMPNHQFATRCTGLENELLRLLGGLVGIDCLKSCEAFRQLLVAERINRAKVEEWSGIKNARKAADEIRSQLQDPVPGDFMQNVTRPLRDQLAAVTRSVRRLADELRKIRDDHEKLTEVI